MTLNFRVVKLLLLCSSISLIASTTAHSQNEDGESRIDFGKMKLEEADKKPKTKSVEKIQVTGSHIKRIDVEGPSPVQVIDQTQLEESGYNSVSDVLRDTSANSFGSMREHSGSNAAGVAHVNLRGLGSSSTLVLLNGKRLPRDGVTGAVDLNLIPMAAVERIEILKDGASALYGSDAIGGVVNIITKKDFSGNEVQLQQSVGEQEGGNKREISLVNGISRGKLNMTNVVHYRKNETVYSRDRTWSNVGVSPSGSPGSYRQVNGDNTTGQWQVDPNCPDDRKIPFGGGERCSYNYAQHSTELPELEQASLMSETKYSVNALTDVHIRVGGTRKEAQWAFAPAPGTFRIPASVADGMGLPGVTPGSAVDYNYRLLELGNRVSKITEDAYDVLAGVKTGVGESWEVELSGGHNRIHRVDRGVSGYALTQKLIDKIASGGFDPSGTPGSRGNILDTGYEPVEIVTSEVAQVELKASGELAEMPAGPLGLAVGMQYTQQSYSDVFDLASVNNEVYGNAGSSGGGSRQTYSTFAEIGVPVTQKLELQVAGRYDNYSDFGDTVNPKVGMRYQATKSLMFRASAGTGFKAPLMTDLYASDSLGYPTFIDQVACNAERNAGGATPSCDPAQYEVTSSGNKGLKEEKSRSFNVGAIFQPNRKFNIGTDIWLTQLNNVVGIDYDSLTEAEAAGVDVSQYGVIVNRDSDGYIESIEAPLQNLSAQEVSGIDVTAGLNLGKVDLSMEHSHMFYFKEEGFPGTGQKDVLGENGRPAWRNTVTLGVLPVDRHKAFVSARTIAGHEKAVKEKGSLNPYTVVDLQYTWAPQNLGEFKFGVKNVAGTTPPLDDSDINNQLDDELYDQIGRQYYVGYTKGF